MRKIIKNDQVVVVAGKDKGKTGKVLEVLGGDKIIVDGVNLVKKHQKPNPMRNIEGGIISKSMPIHISNVAVLSPRTQKPSRVGIKVVTQTEGQKRVRIFKSDDK